MSVNLKTDRQKVREKPFSLLREPSMRECSSPRYQRLASHIHFIEGQLSSIEAIKYLAHTHPRFKEWDRQNRLSLEKKFGRGCFLRYQLIPFSKNHRNGFFLKGPSVSWQDKEFYQRGIQRAKVLFKSILFECKGKIVSGRGWKAKGKDKRHLPIL